MKNFALIRRLLLWTIAIGMVGAAAYYSMRPRPILVDLATVTRGPMDVRVEEDGKTRIRERYIVSSPLAGRLLRIKLDVGDDVQADKTVLAQMEPTDPELLDPREIAQAKARVRAAEQRLEAAKAEQSKAEATVNFTENEMGRTRQMRAANAASESEFAQKELLFRQATEEARAAGYAIDIAEYELELQRSALIFTDRSSTSESEMVMAIRAPIDGRVLRIYQESTAVVTPGTPLIEVGDPSDLEIVADVLSRDAVRITPGDRVVLEQWGGDASLEGRVRLVEPSGFTKLSALGVEEQRVNIVIDFIDPPASRQQLGDGFRVDCEIIVWGSESVLQVPTSALFRVQGQWHVFAVDNSLAKLVAVEVAHSNGKVAEVAAGLAEGTQVVTHPSDAVETGVVIARR